MSIELADSEEGIVPESQLPQNHTIIVKELERLIDRNPEDVIGPLLSEYFQRQEEQKIRGPFSEESLEAAREIFNNGDILGSFDILTQNFIGGPIISTMGRRVREEERKLAALLSQSNTISKGISPETFKLGIKSHHLAEIVECFGIYPLKRLRPKGVIVEPLIEKGKMVGINLRSEKVNQEKLLAEPNKEDEEESKKIIEIERIIFPEPLLAPQEKEEEWALKIIHDCQDIFRRFHCVPEKPHDVSAIYQNQETKLALLKIAEVSYFIFGDDFLWKEGNNTSEEKTVSLEYPDEFAILNLLSVIRLIDESEDNFSQRTTNESVLKELAIGNLQTPSKNPEIGTLDIKGGIMDLIKFRWNGGEVKRGLDFSQAVEYAEDEVRCQRAKYIRVHADKPEKISQRALLRNIRSIFRVFHTIYGEEVFTDLNLTIEDFKFPAGDGGWWTIFNPEDLPDIKHSKKMEEYLFLVAAQLCWVKKLSLINQNVHWGEKNGQKENLILTKEEIVNFILQHDLPQRFNGKIRYQLPTGEVEIEVKIPELREELEEWVNRIIGGKDSLASGEDKKLAILKTLRSLIPKEKLDELHFVLREQKKLPEELTTFCCEYKGQFYLIIDELAGYLERNGNYVFKNAVFYKEYGTWVINLNNFGGAGKGIRIAVNQMGKFTIMGLEEGGILRGELLTTREMRGVRERDNVKFDHFRILISDFLLGEGLLEGVDSGIILDNGTVMDGQGNFKEVVDGKPLVCKMDLMTGQWYLDKTLLQEAIEELGGKRNFGFEKIFNCAFGGEIPNGNLFCPLPWHNNIHTEAAAFYRSKNDKHLHCFTCQEQIEIRTGRGVVHFEPPLKMAAGFEPADYKPVSLMRNKIFGDILRLGKEFVEADENPRNYIASRGLEVSDVGMVGYIPPSLSSFLFDLMDNEALQKIIKKESRFTSLESLLNREGINGGKLDYFLKELFPELRDEILRTFTAGNLREMSLRGIISSRRRKDEQRHGVDTLGGRILFPTHWISSSSNELAISNWIGRGVEIGGVTLYEGVKQHKVRLGKRRKEGGILPTPTGIWIKDKEFILSAKEIVVVESPLNGASLGRMTPQYSKNCIAVVGTGYRELVAFLKWINFGSQENGIIYLGNDYDKGGVEAYLRTKEHIETLFPSVKVLPVRDILPDDIKPIIPPYDLELFTIDNETGTAGPLLGQSLDLNEILTLPGLGRKYAFRGLEEEKEKTRRFLEAMKKLS
jgi:hypothetical protein